jgi:predicted metal-dependent peptidase
MGQLELDASMAEVKGVITAAGVGSQRLMVLACDAAVGATTRVRRIEDVQLVGGGGTDMRVGIAAAECGHPRPDVVVVFTDGYTPWPDRPTRARLVVAIIGAQVRADHVPHWATPVRVTAG